MVGRSIDLFVFGEMWETIYQISDNLEIDLCTWGFTSIILTTIGGPMGWSELREISRGL